MARTRRSGGKAGSVLTETIERLGGARAAAATGGIWAQSVYDMKRRNDGVPSLRVAVGWADALEPDDPAAWQRLVRALVPRG